MSFFKYTKRLALIQDLIRDPLPCDVGTESVMNMELHAVDGVYSNKTIAGDIQALVFFFDHT